MDRSESKLGLYESKLTLHRASQIIDIAESGEWSEEELLAAIDILHSHLQRKQFNPFD